MVKLAASVIKLPCSVRVNVKRAEKVETHVDLQPLKPLIRAQPRLPPPSQAPPSFFVLVICLLLSGDGEEIGWIWFLRGDSDEDEDDNYSVCNFLSMTTWRIRFSDGDIIKAEMVLLPWNNFL